MHVDVNTLSSIESTYSFRKMAEEVGILYVAIEDSIPFKHWALVMEYKDSSGQNARRIFQALGGGDRQGDSRIDRVYFDGRKLAPGQFEQYMKRIMVGQVLLEKKKTLYKLAEMFDQDGKFGWNCQDHVNNLLCRSDAAISQMHRSRKVP